VTRSAARATNDIACLLLAAGGSRRLGAPKQFARYRARPLLLRALAAASGVLPRAPVTVVVGAHAPRVRLAVRRARPDARVVLNSRWHEGMAASLRAGLAATPRTARAVLVLLVDQPRVDAVTLARLVTAWRRAPGRPAAACYGERVGVPAVLPRKEWRALRALRGDEGARALLRGSEPLTLVAMPEAAFDVDTPEDLRELRATL
jgi:CTP:molybdopterin cytidylyltransferase MocA